VSKFQQTAMARQAQAAYDRRDFWLYIDEFDNFITPSMAWILSKTRKYRLGLTLAHHQLHQLQADAKVASAVMSNPATRIVFRVGDDDAKKLAEGFSFFEPNDFKNLKDGQAICRVERSDFDFNISVPLPDEINEAEAANRREKIIAASRAKYGTPRGQGVSVPASPPTPAVPNVSEPPKASEVPKLVHETAAKPISLPPVAETELFRAESDPDSRDEQHTRIKEKICAEAESLEYTATCEVDFPEVHGRADIVLQRGKKKIIGQVTVTTPVKYEAESVEKFLKAGVTHIAVISINRKKLNLIQETLGDGGGKADTVGFYSPSEFIAKLFDWAADDPKGGEAEKAKPKKQPIDFSAGKLSASELELNQQKMLERLKRVLGH